MFRTYYYYYLKDPETGVIRYIGITLNPKERYHAHVYSSHTNVEKNTWKANWVKSLLKRGLKPVMEIFETYETDSVEDAYEREEEFINEHFLKGIPLVNVLKVPYKGSNPGSSRKTVYQYDINTGEFIREFPSVAEAARVLNIPAKLIRQRAKSHGNIAVGDTFRWSYLKHQRIQTAPAPKRGRPSLPTEVRNLITQLYKEDTSLSIRKLAQLCKHKGFAVSRETVRTLLCELKL
jgi:hypothetical protein